MLDSRSQYLNFQIQKVLQICLDFRTLVNKFFLDRDNENGGKNIGGDEDFDSSDLEYDFDINDSPIKAQEGEKAFGMYTLLTLFTKT